ncbi:hypothetical protein D4A35_08355 [Paraclostridium bifermentans]|uniref:Uncharacterized protein n=1 Tax=Paraclostridium bifermentans TaxID=1490 RepID=A0A5P3XF38_PARBF|nr:hypothetical protein [Paraclostridium bifermentans]QEZ68944.1 hypothetical protein D4A35_08355 [Paraclostridium bifermentans]
MMNNINKLNKKDEAMEKSIFDFAWSRLDTLGSGELEEVKEVQEKINNLIEDVINITGRKDIRRLLEKIEEACTEQSTLLEEKAYRLGFKDGLKIVNSL